ncbi:MAG: aminoacyl-histidine dipeptidase [Peptoniphilaceae bacterium]
MTLNIEPKEVFDYFYELNQIPRCSGNEKAVSDFLVNFAKKRNLEAIQDEEYNVIIKKPATKGYENSKTVIIQGHMDMVCVKEENSNHDFNKDPIEMYIEGDYLKAKGTTLGADNGIAVAYALAILDSDTINHPNLEVLITTNEETGMDGAATLKEGILSGDILLNIDSEEEGIFTVSCAGGTRLNFSFYGEKKDKIANGLRINISGLKGGHSGMEIIKARANANKIMARILNEVRKDNKIQIAQISGGTKHNAIPELATSLIYVENLEKAKKSLEVISEAIVDEYRVEDNGLEIEFYESQISGVFTSELTDNLIDFLLIVPDGVVTMSKDIENLVESSLNNAIISEEDNKINIVTSVRSSSKSKMNYIVEILLNLAKLCKADCKISNSYPAWEFEKNSKLREIAMETYADMFEKEANYNAIHAGLECGILKNVLPKCDMISFGPNMEDVHSPKERLSISSAKRMWEYSLKLLENLK